MTDIIDAIRLKQQGRKPAGGTLPEHKPEMLYIGCVDARLDPVQDIGIPQGKALIYRNIAALVRPSADPGGDKVDEGMVTAGEIPESVSIGAVLEFFINHIPANGKKKHIVVSGHTDCGGIRACLEKDTISGERYLPRYLTALAAARERVLQDGRLRDTEQQRRALEEAAVRESLENLMSYPAVRTAVAEGRLELHGWVINTATQQILELDRDKDCFTLIGGTGRGR